MARIRLLDAVELRVLGSLLEKELTTPEQYPLTLNSLVAACNQKNNREPVTELGEAEVTAALRRLKQDALVWRSEGARAERWEHLLDRRLGLEPAKKALITLLFLRGAQTPGELRTRSERLHTFATVAEVEAALAALAAGEEPLVAELGRQPGQRESRWMHRLGTSLPEPGRRASRVAAEGTEELEAGSEAPSLEARVERLEAELAELKAELARLRSDFVPEA